MSTAVTAVTAAVRTTVSVVTGEHGLGVAGVSLSVLGVHMEAGNAVVKVEFVVVRARNWWSKRIYNRMKIKSIINIPCECIHFTKQSTHFFDSHPFSCSNGVE